MSKVLGLDIGTTSIGFSLIDHDPTRDQGRICHIGTRIFPEARDKEKGTPTNQERRQKRMARRQIRRRRLRRKHLNELLSEAGLLPSFSSPEWPRVMAADPYVLRDRGLEERLEPHEVGRMLYHLAKRRHFKGRDVGEPEEDEKKRKDQEKDADEKKAKTRREETLSALKAEGVTLGRWLAALNPHTCRRRGEHATRATVEAEFEALWSRQAEFHPILREADFKARVADAVFAQKPVFWRKNTLGTCRFEPGAELCPQGSWLSQERRMLEKLNNLTLGTGNLRPLDDEERAVILKGLRTQASMDWKGVQKALRPLYKARGEAGAEKTLRFNLEFGGEKGLKGNLVEAKLSTIFGTSWSNHPFRQEIREAAHSRLWKADYGEIGTQRVVIRSAKERLAERERAAQSFITDFGVTSEQAAALQKLTFPSGWEPFSIKALRKFLPHLEAGIRFGSLLAAPEWESWRNETFPNREQPTGEVRDRLLSPVKREEARRIAGLRNPTVVRTQNELRKVVNNLIDLYGKPDCIRVELARDVGMSKLDREEVSKHNRKQEQRRKAAESDLKSNGIAEPSRGDIEKWLLWKECGEFDLYSALPIGFDDLFHNNVFQVEHIWPLSLSFDNGFRNKTLCHRDWNARKNNRLPHEAFGHTEDWEAMKGRVWRHVAEKRMSKGKAMRFCRQEPLPEDFVERQLNDTGYAARQAMAYLKTLWPDLGQEAPVTVQAVSGKVTAQLRREWGLNNILSDNGEKTRADHRHHAIDALVVACANLGYTQKLSAYLQTRDRSGSERPRLAPPWPTIRKDAGAAVADIVVSHRVRKKVSGPLHKETVYGDTGEDVTTKSGVYRVFVTRKKLESLSKSELDNIRDERVREIVVGWVASHGGDPKKAFAVHPRLGPDGPEIRKVRLCKKCQLPLMAKVSTGYAEPEEN
ncbi:MAG: type II CRISPR RNA-guided endonuclease Cas9, partial [Alphaproteobacteria bacterium]